MKLILIILFITPVIILSSTISKTPILQPAGQIHFSALNESSGNTMQWNVELKTINENTGQIEYNYNYASAIGDGVDFNLIKHSYKYTFYKIISDDGISKDTLDIQVFTKNFPQKYLFQNIENPGKPIVVYIVIPEVNSQTNFIMVMHGTNRNADDYIQPWQQFARDNNYIAVAPEFNDNDWPYSRSYNLGNMFTGSNGTGTLLPPSQWSFSVVQKIHDELAEGFGIKSEYSIWGHSAGSQFVHRLMQFLPDPDIKYYLCANAGWYTAPNLTIDYPYGMKHNNLIYNNNDLQRINSENVIVMRGTNDIIRDSNLRTTPEADAQGQNRYQRAGYYFNMGNNLGSSGTWQLIDVPGVGHSNTLMAPPAQAFLLAHPITGIENFSSKTTTEKFRLKQNFPNPFNPSTSITFFLPQRDFVELKIFDVLGKSIAILTNSVLERGEHKFIWNAKNYSSGIYFYQLSDSKRTVTKKMMLIK